MVTIQLQFLTDQFHNTTAIIHTHFSHDLTFRCPLCADGALVIGFSAVSVAVRPVIGEICYDYYIFVPTEKSSHYFEADFPPLALNVVSTNLCNGGCGHVGCLIIITY